MGKKKKKSSYKGCTKPFDINSQSVPTLTALAVSKCLRKFPAVEVTEITTLEVSDQLKGWHAGKPCQVGQMPAARSMEHGSRASVGAVLPAWYAHRPPRRAHSLPLTENPGQTVGCQLHKDWGVNFAIPKLPHHQSCPFRYINVLDQNTENRARHFQKQKSVMGRKTIPEISVVEQRLWSESSRWLVHHETASACFGWHSRKNGANLWLFF